MLRVDVHQPLWSEPLVEALARRSRPPFIRRSGHVWELTIPGEPRSTIDVVGDEVAAREALLNLDGLDIAFLSLSAALGVEGLVRDEAEAVIDGYEAGVGDLPDRLPPGLHCRCATRCRWTPSARWTAASWGSAFLQGRSQRRPRSSRWGRCSRSRRGVRRRYSSIPGPIR